VSGGAAARDDLIPVDPSWNDPFGAQEPERESRGEKKRRAEQLERLGASLVDLPEPKLSRVPMPDDLRAAVQEARRLQPRSGTSSRGGYRRQVQLIGKIMRTLDAEPIAAALEAMKGEDAPSAVSFRAAERWRDRLIDEGDEALAALVVEHPLADRTALRQLLRQAQKEKASGKPPHASRSLFRLLKALYSPSDAP
jgi:ribosome-associated protein